MPGRGEPLTGYRKLCPVCGKEFWAFADWRYRRMDKATRSKTYYCSWKCIRATEIREEEEAKQAEEQKDKGIRIQIEKRFVEVVRCKDCDNKECWGRAGNVVCGIDGTPHRPDWFCADGERVGTYRHNDGTS